MVYNSKRSFENLDETISQEYSLEFLKIPWEKSSKEGIFKMDGTLLSCNFIYFYVKRPKTEKYQWIQMEHKVPMCHYFFDES